MPMQILITIFVFLIIFSFLILIHEWGHFMAARRSGVKVEEFGMGLPPRIWGIKKGETLYSINAIPFGGFVRMLGEDGKKSKSKKSFEHKSPGAQLFIVSAGVLMNFLLAFLLLTLGFVIGIDPLITSQEDLYDAVRNEQILAVPTLLEEGSGEMSSDIIYLPRLRYVENTESIFYSILEDGDIITAVNGKEILSEQDLYGAFAKSKLANIEVFREGDGTIVYIDLNLPTNPPLIDYVIEGSPAADAGIENGDFLVSVGGVFLSAADQAAMLNQSVQSDNGFVSYMVERDGNLYTYDITPDENGLIGVALVDRIDYYGELSLYPSYTAHSLTDVIPQQYGFKAPLVALREMWRLGKTTAFMFLDVFSNFIGFNEVPAGVAGPVGIAQMTFTVVQDGFGAIIRFVAMLSLSLGVVNILPIPALDGGRAVFILYRGFTGRKPDARIEHFIHMIGFFLLMTFIVYITFNDILNLWAF